MEKITIRDYHLLSDDKEGCRTITIKKVKYYKENLLRVEFIPGKLGLDELLMSLPMAEAFYKLFGEKLQELREANQ